MDENGALDERVRSTSEILRIYDEARYREGREPVSTLVQRKRERVKGNGGSLLARRDTETVEEDNKNVHRRREGGGAVSSHANLSR